METLLADAQALARFVDAPLAHHRFQDDAQSLLGLRGTFQVLDSFRPCRDTATHDRLLREGGRKEGGISPSFRAHP
jgi:hypothetical protein